MGGGILPVAIVKGQLKFLLGKEVHDRKWSDFGGGREGNETRFETAIREGCEELDGFLGCQSKLKRLVQDRLVATIDTSGLKTYLFLVDYDENLPVYFNNHHIFIKRKLPEKVNHRGLFEKSELGWFSIHELRSSNGQFRMFYQKVIKNITDNYKNLLRHAKRVHNR